MECAPQKPCEVHDQEEEQQAETLKHASDLMRFDGQQVKQCHRERHSEIADPLDALSPGDPDESVSLREVSRVLQ